MLYWTTKPPKTKLFMRWLEGPDVLALWWIKKGRTTRLDSALRSDTLATPFTPPVPPRHPPCNKIIITKPECIRSQGSNTTGSAQTKQVHLMAERIVLWEKCVQPPGPLWNICGLINCANAWVALSSSRNNQPRICFYCDSEACKFAPFLLLLHSLPLSIHLNPA